MTRISLIGLGAMGGAIGQRLLETGQPLTVWNRTPERARLLVEAGAVLAPSLKAAADADIILTMLADDAAVLGVAPLLARHMPPAALHVSMSTIAPHSTDHLARLHADAGQAFLAAPVFGRPPAAAAGQLFILAAGSEAALAQAQPVFKALGRAHFPLGPIPSQANVAKLAGNFMIMGLTACLGEALAAGQRHGIAPAALLDLFTATLFDTPITRAYGAMLVENRFRPAGFTAKLGTKDLSLFRQAAGDPPIAHLLEDRLHALIAAHGPDIDWAAIGMLPIPKETRP
jgi:3-hydroxyisobutyrate dehydrogenase-like beta-hydroxyacid dehydrogenase